MSKKSLISNEMDIAVTMIDKETQTLEFAEARNPIIYMQKKELHQIKGNIMPIGGSQKEDERIFNSHQIDISEPTTFYLFSDGFQDQFGGDKGKKFMVRRFRDVHA